MAYVIAEPRIGVKDMACVDVCPVDCIHPRKDEADFQSETQLYILCLAKMSSKSKMARFALCLGLKREPELSQECFEERDGSLRRGPGCLGHTYI
jgi:NAD-dependent dihydropyrimidine dehydrogenase PreA subunit